MKTLATLAFALCIAGVQCPAKTLNGRLMDAQCYNQKKMVNHEEGRKTYHSITQTCAATPATTQFDVRVLRGPLGQYEGETIALDDSGNAMAAQAMQSGSLHADKHGSIRVKVSGKVTDDEVLQTRAIDSRGTLFL